MSNYNGGVKSKSSSKQRRGRVITRLEAQLKSGVKTEKNLHPLTAATTGGNTIPLTEKDIERIKKEIEILKTRV